MFLRRSGTGRFSAGKCLTAPKLAILKSTGSRRLMPVIRLLDLLTRNPPFGCSLNSHNIRDYTGPDSVQLLCCPPPAATQSAPLMATQTAPPGQGDLTH